jgi:hypothetical protein
MTLPTFILRIAKKIGKSMQNRKNISGNRRKKE